MTKLLKRPTKNDKARGYLEYKTADGNTVFQVLAMPYFVHPDEARVQAQASIHPYQAVDEIEVELEQDNEEAGNAN